MSSEKKHLNLTALILTYNEEIHIKRCVNSLLPVTSKIIIVDSLSTDRTLEFIQDYDVEIFQHKFVNQAQQLNWALDNLNIQTEWIIRIDADEYIDPVLQIEILQLLSNVDKDINGIYIRRKIMFLGKWIRFGGTYPHIVLRIWRKGKGRCEQRWMDEHIVLTPGSKTTMAQGNIIDDNLKGITFWVTKHNQYASREAVDLLNLKYHFFPVDNSLKLFDDPQARRKRLLKEKLYNNLPLKMRAGLYFLYRYLFRVGFLNGSEGFIYHFMQAYWYRLLVDIKMTELEKQSGGDIEKIKELLQTEHGIKI